MAFIALNCVSDISWLYTCCVLQFYLNLFEFLMNFGEFRENLASKERECADQCFTSIG